METISAACRWITDLPVMGRLRTRSRRRGLAIAMVVLLVAMPLVGAATDSYDAVLVLLVPFLVLVVLLAGATRFLADVPSRRLDEYHRRQREAAFTGAYWVGTVVGLVGGAAIAWVVAGGVDEGLRGGTIVAVGALVSVLPTLAVAWRLPDDPVDEDARPGGRVGGGGRAGVGLGSGLADGG